MSLAVETLFGRRKAQFVTQLTASLKRSAQMTNLTCTTGCYANNRLLFWTWLRSTLRIRWQACFTSGMASEK